MIKKNGIEKRREEQEGKDRVVEVKGDEWRRMPRKWEAEIKGKVGKSGEGD